MLLKVSFSVLKAGPPNFSRPTSNERIFMLSSLSAATNYALGDFLRRTSKQRIHQLVPLEWAFNCLLLLLTHPNSLPRCAHSSCKYTKIFGEFALCMLDVKFVQHIGGVSPTICGLFLLPLDETKASASCRCIWVRLAGGGKKANRNPCVVWAIEWDRHRPIFLR